MTTNKETRCCGECYNTQFYNDCKNPTCPCHTSPTDSGWREELRKHETLHAPLNCYCEVDERCKLYERIEAFVEKEKQASREEGYKAGLKDSNKQNL